MVCPNCRAVGTIRASCSACGTAGLVPAADQFGVPLPVNVAGHPPAASPGSVGYPAPSYPAKRVGNTFSIIGIVLGAVALVAAPVLLGLAGAALAQHAHKRGESLWKTSLIVSVTCLVLGVVTNGLLLAFRVGLL